MISLVVVGFLAYKSIRAAASRALGYFSALGALVLASAMATVFTVVLTQLAIGKRFFGAEFLRDTGQV